MNILFDPEKSRSAAYDDETCIGIAEVKESEGRWIITHTEVDSAYGGQGIARRLIEEIIHAARRQGKKIIPVCSYAEKLMTRNDAYRDVLASEDS